MHLNIDWQIAGEIQVRFKQSIVKMWLPAPRSVRDVLNDALISETLRPFRLSPSNVLIQSVDLNLGIIELVNENPDKS